MSAGKLIKQLMIERNMSVKTLSEHMGIQAQSMSNKIYRDKFSYDEFLKIMDILECDIKITTRDTGKEFTP